MLLSHGAERDGIELYEHVKLLTPWRRTRAWSESNPTGSWPELLRPGQVRVRDKISTVLAAATLATLSEFEGEWTAVMVDLFPMSDVRSDGVGLVKPFG
ncbi:hypothetical protein [Streptomyces griseofuscus]|uniref:hypothetical protein n=1 Tax=Streptomyces griseofuscus TaxID=146922 RepID=UPI0011888E67|nr:hypothetical protein SRO_0946 [Streptomyces rochei]